MSNSQVLFSNARISLIILTVMILLSGCTSMSPMALNKTSGALDLSTKSIAVLTLRTTNKYKPAFQPRVRSVNIVSDVSGTARQFKVDPTDEAISIGEGIRSVFGSSDEFYEYLISVDVEPGTHTLKEVMGMSFKALLQASFNYPVNVKFTVPMRSVIYIGHMDMVNRERKGEELRSGSIFPLVDQAVAGYSGGTFDVNVTDRGETDIPLFIQTYPSLREIQIVKAIMDK